MATTPSPKWAQKIVYLGPHSRGCHLITSQINNAIGKEIGGLKCGVAHLYLQDTSASLTINENGFDVLDATETFLNRIVPEGLFASWKPFLEGPDAIPAYIKSSMIGCSLTIPITHGKLNMGIQQGIWLCEHRNAGPQRKIVITLNGM